MEIWCRTSLGNALRVRRRPSRGRLSAAAGRRRRRPGLVQGHSETLSAESRLSIERGNFRKLFPGLFQPSCSNQQLNFKATRRGFVRSFLQNQGLSSSNHKIIHWNCYRNSAALFILDYHGQCHISLQQVGELS